MLLSEHELRAGQNPTCCQKLLSTAVTGFSHREDMCENTGRPGGEIGRRTGLKILCPVKGRAGSSPAPATGNNEGLLVAFGVVRAVSTHERHDEADAGDDDEDADDVEHQAVGHHG